MIVVTGAMGFIGSNLARTLVGRGRTVLAVDLDEPTKSRRQLEDVALLAPGEKGPGLRTAPRGQVNAWLGAGASELNEVEAVFHLGACSDTTEKRKPYLDDVNVADTLRWLGFCQERQLPLIYASSAAVYGDRLGFREEPACENPLNLYAASKLTVDDHVRAEVLPAPRAPVVGLRYFNVYGPHESHKGKMASVAYKLHRQLQRSGEVSLFSGSHGYADGEQSRDFVYVDDAVAVTLWFLDHPEHSGIYNVGTGKAEPFNAIARAVLDHAGSGTLRYVPFPDELRDQYQAWTQADLTRLRSAGCDLELRDVASGVRAYLDRLTT